jgi:hypothetical protein
MTSVISYGPMCFRLSFLLGWVVDIFRVSSHTLSPISNGVLTLWDLMACLDCTAWALFISALSSLTRCFIHQAICWAFTSGISLGS